MANSNLLLELRFVLESNEEAEIVKNTLNPEFYEYKTTRTPEDLDYVCLIFNCRSFDFSDYVNVTKALNKTYVAFIVEKSLD